MYRRQRPHGPPIVASVGDCIFPPLLRHPFSSSIMSVSLLGKVAAESGAPPSSMGMAINALNDLETQLDNMLSAIDAFDSSTPIAGSGQTPITSHAILSASPLGQTVWDAKHNLSVFHREAGLARERAGGIQASQEATFLEECYQLRRTVQTYLVDSGVWALSEIRAVDTKHRYVRDLEAFTDWLHRQRHLLRHEVPSHDTVAGALAPINPSTPFPDAPRRYGPAIDAYELRVAEDFLKEEWEWVGYARNVAAPQWELNARLAIIKDIRQQVQEERDRAAVELQADDYALATHLNPSHRAGAVRRRRFQLLQHLAKRALSLKHSQPAGLSLAQRYRAENVSRDVLHWIDVVQGFATEQGDESSRSPHSLLDPLFTERLAAQLDKLQAVVSDVAAPADIIARQNELAALEDYVRTAMVHPTLSTCIKVEELRKLLLYLDEWRDAFPQGTTAAGYDTIIEVFMDAAHRCGLSVLAGKGTAALNDVLTTKPPVVVAPYTNVATSLLVDEADDDGNPTDTPASAEQPPLPIAEGGDDVGQITERAVRVGCNLAEALQQLRVQLSVAGGTLSLPIGIHGAPSASERRAEARRIAKDELVPLQTSLKLALDVLEGGLQARAQRLAATKVLGSIQERTEALFEALKNRYSLEIPSSCWLLVMEARSM